MKDMDSNRWICRALCLALALGAWGGSPLAAKEDVVERYRITAIGEGHYGFAAGRATRLNLIVYRWTTDAEREEILDVLRGTDGKAVVADLENREVVGRLIIPGQSGANLRMVWKTQLEDGRTVVVAGSERSLLSEPGRTTGNEPYYIAVVQLVWNDGEEKGEGVLMPGISPEFEADGTVKISSTVSDPVKLSDAVSQLKKK